MTADSSNMFVTLRRHSKALPGSLITSVHFTPVAMLLSAAILHAGTFDPIVTSGSSIQMGPQMVTVKNWAGYVAETNLSIPQNNSVTGVSGSWVVPAVTPSPWLAANATDQQSECAVWVGIDGWFGSNTVEQIGTESYIFNGATYYDAFYEMYPDSMKAIYNVRVSPGDSITASVQYGLASDPNQFQLMLTDNTSGQTFTTYKSNTSALRASAEWIAEAPSSGSKIYPLPTFGSVPFTDAQATFASTGAIDDPSWQAAEVNMRNDSSPNWVDSMSASALTTVGSGESASSSFTVVQTPEPSTLACLAVVAMLLVFRRIITRKGSGPR